jgi:hypothetical protein
MEGGLKIFKVEYLSNKNLCLDDETILYKFFKWRRPNIEDDLKIFKVEYLSDHVLDHTQILDLSLYDQPTFVNP